jgi:tetratricopeptide (TPR) repeat protein
MDKRQKIVRLPENSATSVPPDYDDEYDFESWEGYQEFLDKEDYPGLVRYCEQEARRAPDDPWVQYFLGEAYNLNGEYQKAIEFLADHHKRTPCDVNFQQVILDALFALGKTEDDFAWSKKPVVLRMSSDIVDSCYEFLKRKRKPRDVMELHTLFVYDGYLRFTEEDLLQALLKDGRFDVENPDDVFDAEVRVMRKKRGKREHRQR